MKSLRSLFEKNVFLYLRVNWEKVALLTSAPGNPKCVINLSNYKQAEKHGKNV